jgi:hypothetical protein
MPPPKKVSKMSKGLLQAHERAKANN